MIKAEKIKLNISRNIKKLLSESGKKNYEVAAELGISESVMSKWASGLQVPEIKSLEKLSEYFDVSVATFFLDQDEVLVHKSSVEDLLNSIKGN